MRIKKVIQEDFNRMHNYFLEYDYKAIVACDNTKNELKHIHKAAYVFFTWRIELNKNNMECLLFDEIISTLIQIIHVSIYKDIKILYMLFRNIIDNFIKIIYKYHKLKDRKYTLQIFEEVLLIPYIKNSPILEYSYRKILNLYKTSCGYVHSTQRNYLSLHESIRSYNNSNEKDFRKCINDFYNLMKNINNILIIYYNNIYEYLTINDRKLIHYFCNREDLKRIFSYLYGVNYE